VVSMTVVKERPAEALAAMLVATDRRRHEAQKLKQNRVKWIKSPNIFRGPPAAPAAGRLPPQSPFNPLPLLILSERIRVLRASLTAL
jgi:hypothetical protein